jgi:S1-C subfamily serine protease
MRTGNQNIRKSGYQDWGLRFGVFAVIMAALTATGSAKAGENQTREAMKGSIVYLEISSYSYDQIRPWKNTDIQQKGGVGCATGTYQVITPAWNLTDAKLIKAKVSWQNEYIPATIKTIDYEVDLAILELDANAMKKPLKPIRFEDKFQRGAKLNYYSLNSNGEMTTGQGYLDRAELWRSTVSYASFLNVVVTNTSQETASGQVYCDATTPIGISCWSKSSTETGLIPAVIINNFLAKAKDTNYPGVPAVGFAAEALLDPAMRTYLKMPATMKNGVQVTSVYSIGTGDDLLKESDVILAIDGKEIDAYGKFLHPAYDRIMFHHLITSHKVGDDIVFDIWRDGSKQQLRIKAKNFDVGEMLVPYYEYGEQPEYVVTCGFVFQKLTRPYMANWGKDWEGKVTPHLLHYFRDMAFKPTAQRREIVILSYCLPAQINLGYTDLSQIVVSKFNGMPISRLSDIVKAQKLNPGAKYDVVEFELDNPTVVIPRQQLQQADAMIATSYGIRKPVNVKQ